jgi:chemotaxis protein histidine kinase CheA
VGQTDSLRIASISPYGLPHSYRQWATSLWKRPMNEWSFQLMYETLLEAATKGEEQPILDANSAWMKAIEEAIQELEEFSNHVRQQAEAKAQQAEAKAQQAEAKAQQAEAKAQQAEAKAQQAEAKAQQAEAKAQQAEAKAQQAEAKAQQAEAKAQQAEAASTQALMQLQAVYTSTSWRITAPLRGLAGQAFKLSPQRLKPQIKLLLRHAALYVHRRPRLRNTAFAVLNRFPTLKQRLVSLITSTPVPTTNQQNGPAELAQLTPRARQIYADLKAAIEARNKDGR